MNNAEINYYCLHRQDKKDRSRAPISAKLVANMLRLGYLTVFLLFIYLL
jgi:phosphoribosylpyrophosphate synthetase